MDSASEINVNPMGIDPARIESAVGQLVNVRRIRYRRLWAYYRNPMRPCDASGEGPACDRPYRQAQEWGLPARITGVVAGAEPFAEASVTGRARKEVVIENDIGWRIDTMTDYLFGKPLVISSTAADLARREVITRLLDRVLTHNGGVQFLQQIALMGAVHGFVDVLVKLQDDRTDGEGKQSSPGDYKTPETQGAAGPARDPESGAPDRHDPARGEADPSLEARIERAARRIRLEIVEPARALPLLSPDDWRKVDAFGQVWERDSSPAQGAIDAAPSRRSTWWDRLRSVFLGDGESLRPSTPGGQVRIVEIITPNHWMRLENGRLAAQGNNSLGQIPLVHIQNTSQTQSYSGASDVEPLIPLQDELNTRLSDRAHRITLQSFKMYLGKGIERFNDQPIAPGRMWMTDNEQAEVIEFGGDASCPSEESHIAELREALDKSSGVTPIAAGAIKNRIGRLTSAAALRITLLALLSKTDKKRTLYGAGLARICELALAWLDVSGAFNTTPEERQIELAWPSPLPENALEKLQEAQAKLDLGVEKELVLRELGY